MAAADLDALDAALGGPRAAGWPAPRRPGGDDDAELDGRDLICGRLVDEVGWLRRCVGWLTGPHTEEFPPVVNWHPEGGHSGRACPRHNPVGSGADRVASKHANRDLVPGGTR